MRHLDEVARRLITLSPNSAAYPWQSDAPWIRLISEILLSRTRRNVVARVFPTFIERWPDAESLSDAKPSDVWNTVRATGFRRRANHLIETATIVRQLGGVPRTRDSLLELPGVGYYTADAVQLLAFDGSTMPLDMNIDRVVSRIAGIEPTGPGRSPYSRPELAESANSLLLDSVAQRRDTFTGLLELSASTCRPAPRCETCPLSDLCDFVRPAR